MRHQHGGIGEDNETRFPHSYAVYGQRRAALGLVFPPPEVQICVKDQGSVALLMNGRNRLANVPRERLEDPVKW